MLDYYFDMEVFIEWLEEYFGCFIELLGYGNFFYCILKCYYYDE